MSEVNEKKEFTENDWEFLQIMIRSFGNNFGDEVAALACLEALTAIYADEGTKRPELKVMVNAITYALIQHDKSEVINTFKTAIDTYDPKMRFTVINCEKEETL